MKKTFFLVWFTFICMLPVVFGRTVQLPNFSSSETVHALILLSNGDSVVMTNGTDLSVYSLKNKKVVFTMPSQSRGRILTLDGTSDGKYLASGGTDSSVILWDVAKRSKLEKLNLHRGIVTSVRISHHGNYLLSGGTDRRVVLYDLIHKSIAHVFPEAEGDVTCVGFTPDDRFVVVSGLNQPVRIYQVSDFNQIASINVSPKGVSSFDINNLQTTIVLAGLDGKLSYWDITNPIQVKLVKIDPIKYPWILHVKFGLDGQIVTFGTFSGTIYMHAPCFLMKKNMDVPVLFSTFQSDTEDTLLIGTKGLGIKQLPITKMVMDSYVASTHGSKSAYANLFVNQNTFVHPDGKNPDILRLFDQNKLDSAELKLNTFKRGILNPLQRRFLVTDLMIRKNNLDSAIAITEQYLDKDPHSEAFLCVSAWLWEQKGDSANAMTNYQRALDRMEYVKYFLNDGVQFLQNDLCRLYLKKKLLSESEFIYAYKRFKSDNWDSDLAEMFLELPIKDFILKVLEGRESVPVFNME
jgi:hypothetical protein